MKEASAGDAVEFFNDNVEQFDELYQSSEGFQERVSLWDGLLKRYASPGGTAIDLGCGAGIFSFRLAELGHQVVGVDGSSKMLAFCEAKRRKLGLENVRFTEGRLPFIDEMGLRAADVIVSSSVIEYVPQFEQTLELFARLLKVGGALIVSMPNAHSISRNYTRISHRLRPRMDVNRYILHFSSPTQLAQRVSKYGLSFREAHYYTHITRLARLGHSLRLPRSLTEDLFVAVFRKHSSL